MSDADDFVEDRAAGQSVAGTPGSFPTPATPRGYRVFPSPVEALLVPQTLPPPAPATFDELDTPVRAWRSPRDTTSNAALARSFQGESRFISGLDLFLLLFFFVAPIGLGVWYFGFVAANQYVSEFRFNVVDTSSSSPAIAGGLASVLGGSGMGMGSNESYTVTDYITSPQAVQEVSKQLPLRAMLAKAKDDWVFHFDQNVTQEKFNWYWRWMVDSYFDPVTGIATAQVRAFSREDARQIATTLLKSAEALVNNLQQRQRDDTIKFAQEALDRDNAALAKIRGQMLALRQKSGYIEPSVSGVAENIALATNLRLSIVTQQAEVAALNGEIKNSSAPMVQALNNKIAASKDQLAIVEKEIATKGNGAPGPLAATVGEFDDLNAQQITATSIMAADLVTLQQARAAADAQHIYLSTYVYPTDPTSSTFPNRPLAYLLVSLIAFGMFCFAKLVATAIRSHAN